MAPCNKLRRKGWSVEENDPWLNPLLDPGSGVDESWGPILVLSRSSSVGCTADASASSVRLLSVASVVVSLCMLVPEEGREGEGGGFKLGVLLHFFFVFSGERVLVCPPARGRACCCWWSVRFP